MIHMKKEKLNIVNGKNSITIKFLDYNIAEVTINGQRMITRYQQNLNLDEVAQKLTDAIIKEEKKSKRPSIYSSVFPAFGREFKMLVANILKARA